MECTVQDREECLQIAEWNKPMVIAFNGEELEKAGELARATTNCSNCWC